MADQLEIEFTLNGRKIRRHVPARLNLVDFLRHTEGLTGSHVGCEHGVCGACSVRVNGDVVRGCLMLAAQADQAKIETIEAIADSGEIADLIEAFQNRNALQCGFCTSGMLLTAQELLTRHPNCDRADIRAFMAGNLCRCTGYQAIIDAIERVALARRSNA